MMLIRKNGGKNNIFFVAEEETDFMYVVDHPGACCTKNQRYHEWNLRKGAGLLEGMPRGQDETFAESRGKYGELPSLLPR